MQVLMPAPVHTLPERTKIGSGSTLTPGWSAASCAAVDQ